MRRRSSVREFSLKMSVFCFSLRAHPRVSHKTLHPGLISVQPSGLGTPEACKNISPGYAFFAYPGKTFTAENRTPEVVRGLASLLRVDFRVLCIFILDSSGHRPPLQ